MRASRLLTAAFVAVLVLPLSGCMFSRPHPLEGKQAPTFIGAKLDGSEVALSNHIGNEVVMLDFWASWCPPCREGLPAVAEVARDYRGQPVTVYAINQGEDRDTINAFLSETGLDLVVLSDEQGDLGALYGVRGIPQTVIIDKTGRIADVHVGYGRGDERGWRRTIDALLAAEG